MNLLHTKAQQTPKSVPARLLIGYQRSEAKPAIGFATQTTSPRSFSRRKALFHPDAEGHLITVGPTGSGKGVGALVPTLLTYPGSVIVVDVKGELSAVTIARRRAMGQQVVVLDPFNITQEAAGSYNPLDHARFGLDTEELATEIAALLNPGGADGTRNRGDGGDDFWAMRADGLIAGIISYLLTVERASPKGSLIGLRDALLADDTVYGLAVNMDKHGKTLPPLAYRQIAAFLQTVEVTRSGILATAIERVSQLFAKGVESALATTSIPLEKLIAGEPVSVYIVIPPGKLRSHSRLLRLWVGSLLSLLQTRKQRPEIPTLLLLDEAAQLGRLEQLHTAVTLMRGYCVRVWSFFQDLSQIKRLYGEGWQGLVGNSALQLLGANSLPSAEALAGLTGGAWTADRILALSADEGLCVVRGKVDAFTKLNYLRDARFRGMAAPNPFYERGIAQAANETETALAM